MSSTNVHRLSWAGGPATGTLALIDSEPTEKSEEEDEGRAPRGGEAVVEGAPAPPEERTVIVKPPNWRISSSTPGSSERMHLSQSTGGAGALDQAAWTTTGQEARNLAEARSREGGARGPQSNGRSLTEQGQ